MTDDEKATFLRACELAEKISKETELAATIDFDPQFSFLRFVSTVYKVLAGGNFKSLGVVAGLENIVPYLETIYQFAPRKAAGA